MTRGWRLIAAVAVAGTAVAVHAQSQAGTAPQPQQAGARPAPPDRDEIRARLVRRLEDARRLGARLEQAINRLDAGAAPDEVRDLADAPPGDRAGRPPRQGMRFAGRPDEGEGPGRRDGGPDERPFTRQQAAEFVREHLPRLWERFEQARARSPQEFDQAVDRVMPMVRDLASERDPRLREARVAEFDHGMKVFGAARRLGELIRGGGSDADLAAARGELRTLIGEQFDLRLALHRAEIASLEERLARLRADAEEQSAKREQMIEDGVRRIEERARRPRRESGGRPDERP